MTADKKKEKVSLEKVLLDGKNFESKNLNKFEESNGEIELPELNPLLGLGADKIAIVKVKQLTLDEFIKIQGDSISHIKNLMDGIVEASHSEESVETTMLDALKEMDGRTKQLIETIKAGLVEPKLNRPTIIKISRMWPMAAYKMYSHINMLTSKGADLKKNSS